MADAEDGSKQIDAELESIGVPQFVNFHAPDLGADVSDSWFEVAKDSARHDSIDAGAPGADEQFADAKEEHSREPSTEAVSRASEHGAQPPPATPATEQRDVVGTSVAPEPRAWSPDEAIEEGELPAARAAEPTPAAGESGIAAAADGGVTEAAAPDVTPPTASVTVSAGTPPPSTSPHDGASSASSFDPITPEPLTASAAAAARAAAAGAVPLSAAGVVAEVVEATAAGAGGDEASGVDEHAEHPPSHPDASQPASPARRAPQPTQPQPAGATPTRLPLPKTKGGMGGLLSRLWRPTAATAAKQHVPKHAAPKHEPMSISEALTSPTRIPAPRAERAAASARPVSARPAGAAPPHKVEARPATARAHKGHFAAPKPPKNPGTGLPLSTDERRLQQAQCEMAEARDKQRARSARLHKILSDVGTRMPARSTKGLTMPHEFSFKSDARTHGAESRASGAAAEPFVPLAQAVSSFAWRAPSTPEREGTISGTISAESSAVSATGAPRPTKPAPFRLATEARHRPTTVLSTEERQLQEIEAAKAAMHARPVSAAVMNSHGHLGVPRVQKAKPTAFAEFSLSTDRRAAARTAASHAEHALSSSSESSAHGEGGGHFRARPVPSTTYTPERTVAKRPATAAAAVPHRRAADSHGPALATAARAIVPRAGDARDEPDTPTRRGGFRARPMPLHPTPTPVKHGAAPASKPLTSPAAFELQTEARGALASRAFEERRRQETEAEKQARAFKARGVPQAEPFQPVRAQSKLCSPHPFDLKTDARHQLSQAQFDAMVAEQENEMRRHAHFKARECTVTKQQPFQAHKSTKPLTELQDVMLHSDERHAERAAYDAQLKQRRKAAEAAARAEAEAKAAREKLEIAEMRKRMVIKARPVSAAVLGGQPVVLKQVAKKALTVAMSPKFATTMRVMARRGRSLLGHDGSA